MLATSPLSASSCSAFSHPSPATLSASGYSPFSPSAGLGPLPLPLPPPPPLPLELGGLGLASHAAVGGPPAVAFPAVERSPGGLTCHVTHQAGAGKTGTVLGAVDWAHGDNAELGKAELARVMVRGALSELFEEAGVGGGVEAEA